MSTNNTNTTSKTTSLSSQQFVDINSLPELINEPISDNDKFFVFKTRTYTNPETNTQETATILDREVTISELYTMFYGSELQEKFNQKYSELQQLINEFIEFLKNDYATFDFVEKNIATVEHFNDTYLELPSRSTIENDILVDYTSTKQLETFKQNSKIMHEQLKSTNLDASSGDVIFGI